MHWVELRAGNGSLSSPRQGKGMDQAQGPSRESLQEQNETGLEMGLETRPPLGSVVHPGDEAGDKLPAI